ncbi:2-amino-4-hydroxy-6-hydroxymethyldihydropteridine diphosphokinase [Alterisphingorhabdus coralli]|uniref:2-amino-4-hydroxy-6-hydroxymethyldihydropteridine pyrophosphokinase n=1 Tax=Alterisphingorhabdus coralli TaxID=3071408 RepID=A0AA97F5M1_9SPHN|nr:2-amino-4-hydroxy-6-hydroxymethyldihydropteridine diphosphokinase [Parasphingorhabdus sp. SCSIO 66989]WOE74651.1 2-amino-4-hydroxy-6-hydroxymethyldihydropteridine diphosphokinase [Parasphingorhabdus sp. SCSIO 66989]
MDETSATSGLHRYLIALGSNRRHPRYGLPQTVLNAAIIALDKGALRLVATAPIMTSAPIGPSQRTYANSAALIETHLMPPALLTHLKQMEGEFGTRHRRRWSSRVLDLDIILWSGGIWITDSLTIPHPAFRDRDFVLKPAKQIANQWRDPVTGWTVAQLATRNKRARNRPKRVDPSEPHH